MERNVNSKEHISGSGSSAASCGISLEAYQAIRVAVAEEVAMNSHSSSATERGAVSRERRDSGSAHGTIVVRQTFLNLVSIYYIYIILF